MRRLCISLATAMTTLAAGSAAAQQPGIFGIYNPATGQFQPAPLHMVKSAARESGAAEATVARSGIIKVVITIAVKNPTAATVLPNCYIGVSHSPAGHYYSNSQSVQGTRVGDIGKCVAVINYKWPAASTTSPVSLSASAYVGSWSASVPIEPIALPANGATTTVNANTVL